MANAFTKLSTVKQTSILNAAASIFACKGYHQASIQMICEKANISNGALYKYFKNKEDLYIQVISSFVDRLRLTFNSFDRNPELAELSFSEVIEAILHQIGGYIEAENDYLKIYLDMGSASMNKFSSCISQEFEESSYEFWVNLIKRAKSAGEIRENIDMNSAAYMLDNHLALLAYSCISEHHDKRFNAFFRQQGEDLSLAEKSVLVKGSILQFLT